MDDRDSNVRRECPGYSVRDMCQCDDIGVTTGNPMLVRVSTNFYATKLYTSMLNCLLISVNIKKSEFDYGRI